MAVYYFETEKHNERNFPSNKKYVCIVQPVKPTPENGKKRISAEQRKKYESDMEKYNKCIALLESGHVDIYNNYLETEDSDNFAVRMLYDDIPERERVFRIKPIQSRTNYGSYGRRDTLVVSEFDVEKEIKSSDELLDVLIENYDYFRLENQIFKQGTYVNYKEKSFNVFKKLYEKTGDKYLGDLIHGFMDSYNEIMVHSYYNNEAVHDYAKELMDLGYVKLYYDKDSSVWSSIIRFLKLKWTDFALETIKSFIDNNEQIKKIKELLLFIHSNYASPLSLKGAADFCGYSVSYFTKFFKSFTGMTLVEYMNHYRLEKACELLLTTDLSVIEISENTGFENHSYFIRLFRRQYQMTPLKYRRSSDRKEQLCQEPSLSRQTIL